MRKQSQNCSFDSHGHDTCRARSTLSKICSEWRGRGRRRRASHWSPWRRRRRTRAARVILCHQQQPRARSAKRGRRFLPLWIWLMIGHTSLYKDLGKPDCFWNLYYTQMDTWASTIVSCLSRRPFADNLSALGVNCTLRESMCTRKLPMIFSPKSSQSNHQTTKVCCA